MFGFIKQIKTLRCSRCKKHKGLNDFSRDRSTTRGYSYYCKVCAGKVYKQDNERRKRYRAKHGKRWSAVQKRSMNKARFGGVRERVIQRDGEKCVDCLMTRKQHKRKYGRDITVRHVHGPGRKQATSKSDYDNNPKNLITLCLGCNGKRFKRGI